MRAFMQTVWTDVFDTGTVAPLSRLHRVLYVGIDAWRFWVRGCELLTGPNRSNYLSASPNLVTGWLKGFVEAASAMVPI
ncbi:hypothetical protein FHX70_001969 [Slackia isoflavoniconvertens]|nr:hypothetical protein [Slackia isoflavoniconvertens]